MGRNKKEVVKKVCKVCGQEKELKLFVKHRGYKTNGGYSDVCKECNNKKYNTSFKDDVKQELKVINEKLDFIIEKK
jgi:superfamily II helicase